MHSFSPISSSVEDLLQLMSKFLAKLLDNGILKSYTFLYSENYSCVEKNYENVVETIDEFKGLLLKICSSLPVIRKNIIEHDTFNLLNSTTLADCISRNDDSAFGSHNNYNLYSADEIDDPLEQNIQYISDNAGNICNNLSQNIPTACTNDLESRIDFVPQELSDNPLKRDSRNINFTECESFSGILKVNEDIQPSIPYSMNANRNGIIMSHKTESINYAKNSVKIDSLDSNIEALDSIKYPTGNDSLFNTLKEAISGDFLQNIKFNSSDNNRTNKNNPFSEPVQYTQCDPSLQQIDLDILSNSNERINHALDGIFDEQFTENDTLLESECWNVDINLPLAGTMQNSIASPNNSYGLSSCGENLKSKPARPNLSNNSISGFDHNNSSNLNDSITNNLNDSLRIDTAMNASLSSSISNGLSVHEKKYENEFEPEKYYCEHCVFICNSKMKLKLHLKRQHNVYMSNVNHCGHCGKTFRHRPALVAHIRIHQDLKPYKCQYCWKSFTQKITYNSHVLLHTGLYKFSCSICHKRFPTQAKLNFHMKSHENPQWRCEICSKMFTTKQYLKAHAKSHIKPIMAPEKCLSCIKCSMLFEKNSELLSHVRDTHPDVRFKCYYAGCARHYSSYKKLRDHIYKKHTLNKMEKDKICSKFQCNLCHREFVEKDSFHRHNLLVHREKITLENAFACLHCDKQFTDASALEDHLEKFHVSNPTKEMDYSCPLCGSHFYQESSLTNHMSIHSNFGTHVCPTCGSIFNEKNEYLIHLSVHEVKEPTEFRKFKCECCESYFENRMELRQHELDMHNIVPNVEELRPHACLYCDKRFTTRGKCNLHMETHSENRKYNCLKCSKRFFRRDLLKEHMNTHTGYRGHVCKVCGLGFSKKTSLKVHVLTHERKDTFTCDQCGKIFQSKQALNYHVKTHEGNFAFACDVCGKQFVRKCHYDMHVRSHSNERPFKCAKCDITYKTNKHLRDHVKKSHQDEANFSSLMNSMIYTDDEMISQQSILDEYIPPINSLQSELLFPKG